MNIKRVPQYDIARALCVLYIVVFWHGHDYLGDNFALSTDLTFVCERLTTIVLACFTFISGYFLRKYKFEAFADVKSFYVKRIKRFYVLFFISALLLFLLKWMDLKCLITTVLGLGTFFTPSCRTLWYMSMLMFFYMLTPLLKQNRDFLGISTGKICSLVLFPILCVLYKIGIVDIRILMYMPFYIIGIYSIDLEKCYSKKIFVLSTVCLFVCFVLKLNGFLWWYVYMFLGVVSLLNFCFICRGILNNKIIQNISYASMCAYLFHREFFEIVPEGFFYNGCGILTVLIASMVVFYSSFYIQKFYDKLSASNK